MGLENTFIFQEFQVLERILPMIHTMITYTTISFQQGQYHSLPTLSYDYIALEPYIDAKTMEIHHTKHHQGYTDKLNAVLEKYEDLASRPVEELLKDLENLPMEPVDKMTLRNNG